MKDACTARTPGLTGYKIDQCRCRRCKDASRLYEARRRRLTAYGRWETFIDAGEAREHVAKLRAAGIGTRRIAELAGVGQATVNMLAWPRRGHGHQIRPTTAAAILAVPVAEESLHPRSLVDSIGTQRRIQALQTQGWSLTEIAARVGCSRENVGVLLRGTHVQLATRQRLARVYDEMEYCEPEPGFGVTRVRRHAAARGWAPPWAWDVDTIDNPRAEPQVVDVTDDVLADRVLAGERHDLTPADRAHVVAIGCARGIPMTVIGKRIGASLRTVRKLAEESAAS